MRYFLSVFLLFLFPSAILMAQESEAVLTQNGADSTAADSTKIDLIYLPVTLLKDSTLKFNLEYSGKEEPKIFFPKVTLPDNPLEIDMRGTSYYTPREVQDHLDKAMNRPRSESLVPVFALAAFAARMAEKQLKIQKLLEKKAEDYLITDSEWHLLTALWKKAPMNVEELYRVHKSYSARAMEKELLLLNDKGLLKTRKTGNGILLFYPAQKAEAVLALFNSALPRLDKDPQTLKRVLERKKDLEKIILP